MTQKIYVIRDSKGEFYNTPFYQRTHGEAERNFKTLANDEKSNVNKFPEDYDLYYIGDYDDIRGTISAMDTPQHIIKAVQLVSRPN